MGRGVVILLFTAESFQDIDISFSNASQVSLTKNRRFLMVSPVEVLQQLFKMKQSVVKTPNSIPKN